MNLLQVAPYSDLLSHSRYLLTLRSEQGAYHSLILFRLSGSSDTAVHEKYADSSSSQGSQHSQLYAMESTCPHLGLDMSHAEIEDCESSVVAVCPWHRYDFDLRTGHSETGLKACTYKVEIRSDESAVEKVWVETPEEGHNWRLVELRPVSEEFADPPPTKETLHEHGLATNLPIQDENIVPLDNHPKTLIQWAVLILNTADPTMKVQRTRHAVHMFRTGQLSSIGQRGSNVPRPPDLPPRHEAYVKNTVDPSKIGRRKNRAVMLHALANIEQWAIDLAWDIIARFGPIHPDLPPAFYSDFAKVALDESKHFSLLCSRLSAISPETPYGSLPVHASLWESASITFSSLRARLAIIHLVQEARGLDVNPATIEKFRRQGDADSVKVLEVIHTDEVTHVTAGHRWFTWMCAKEGVDPVKTFREDVRRCWRGDVKGPFNAQDREKAGLTRDFYEDLRGEMGWVGNNGRYRTDSQPAETLEGQTAAVQVEYEKERR
ncbi:DUF455-domain-containing protein [Gloeophyllum trabeum ATCC 11539]|uniref:DUF455-domain-containing protein n=1 Tax=Gloeophyllum trabeum (strain ATCC 11539 / FP-39264 / Madison 617) TaxID=670483 RepID=S7PZD8_GLOTA|nr:DUF455-domain-containing protein [Gloeophyllum trabeum ATCC 11539]EPQ53011.1 DUF455-domain-containing protein [Gloeophyllum trabeum ATCC 11539]